jgi:D-arginine dehydrogenase
MEQFDICIVGGGIAGASVAYFAAPHARVLLLEREPQAGYHSTGRSAAVYSPQYGSLLNRRLTAVAGDFLRAPPAGFAAQPLLTPRGFLTIGHDSDLAARDDALAEAAATGETLLALTPAEIRARIPFLKADAVTWGLLDSSAEDMDVEAMLQGYLRGARENGAVVRTNVDVVTLERDGAGWRLQGPALDVRAGQLVNAAGAWADEVAQKAGVAPLGVVPHRRTALVCDVPNAADLQRCPMTVWGHESFYFKPEAGRLLISLAEETPTEPADAQPEELDVAIAVDRVEQVVNFEIRKLQRAWAGLRSFVADRDPVSGFDEHAGGFYWHAALGGYGIQTSPALGLYAASALVGRALPDAFAAAGIIPATLAPARLGERP